VEQPTVAILSEDPQFIELVVQSWRRLRFVPEFAVVTAGDDLVCNPVVLTDNAATLSRLSANVVLAIAVIGDEEAQHVAAADWQTRVVRIGHGTASAEQAAVLAGETVLRLQAQAQLAQLNRRLHEAERFAALGRFFAEARHGLGNALTGVLGHSELLLLDGGKDLQGGARAQVETIRQMSLKLHETFHRLSSMDMELRRKAEQESAASSVQ